jgi:hypothetical protein
MNPEELKRHLREMAPGETFSLPYDICEGMFAPGESDQDDRLACAKLAEECGCSVRNDDDAQQVRFTKKG